MGEGKHAVPFQRVKQGEKLCSLFLACISLHKYMLLCTCIEPSLYIMLAVCGFHSFILFRSPLILGKVSLEIESGLLPKSSTNGKVIFLSPEDVTVQLERAQHRNG